MKDNYKELAESLDEWSCDSFFGSVDPSSYEDKRLRELLLKADRAYWNLRDYIDRKI